MRYEGIKILQVLQTYRLVLNCNYYFITIVMSMLQSMSERQKMLKN